MDDLLAGYRRGMLAMIPAVLVVSLISMIVNWPWPLEPIAERVMMATPVDLAQQLLVRLGPLARPLALFGGFCLSLLIGGLVGVVAPRISPAAPWRWAPALMLLAGLLLVAFPPLFLPPTLILAAVYLVGLARPWAPRRGTHHAGAPGNPSSRRLFLTDSARILGGTALLIALLLLDPWYKGLAVRRRSGRLFAFQPVGPRRAGFDLAGLTPEITPPEVFYYLTKNLVDPDLAADGWTLRVDGLVEQPLALGFDDLLALPARSQYVTQECVSNPVGGPLMSCALFTGVALRRLLLRARPLPQARQVVMHAPDGHADSIPLALALDQAVLVAYGMNGAYLERAHGYPARMLIPGSYGFKSIKWVERIELVAHAFAGTWQERGWTAAIVHTTARIDLARPAPGGTLVAGVAFAGARGIQAVQVRANGGAWTAATLHVPPLSRLTWVQWRTVLPTRGRLTLEARAIDGTGTLQEAGQSDIYPAGATGYHRLDVTV